MKNFTLECRVLESKGGTFTPEGGREVNWKNALVQTTLGQIIKLKSRVDLKSYENKDVTLELELFSGQSYSAGVRVIGIQE